MLGLIFCHRMAGQMTAEQRVLLVTYHFPPDQEVGALRGWPDHTVGWWPRAVLAGRRFRRQARYRALIPPAPPHTAHLVGLALSRRDVRWIVDLRDPWVDNPGKPRSARSGISDELDRRSDRAVLTPAAPITVGTTRFRLETVRAHP